MTDQPTLEPTSSDEKRPQDDTSPNSSPVQDAERNDEKTYPPTRTVVLTMIAIYLVFFLVALDRTIIGTAIPSITAEFNSFGDVSWYESSFLLALCVLQLSFGLVFKYYSTKWTIFTLTAIFEIGSIVCALAPNSHALIIGRAITGIGGAGIGPGSFLFVTLLVPLEDRPKYLGSLGSCFGIASILGPVLGGYLTSVTWRWCFWINVPIGGLAMIVLFLLAPDLPPPLKPATTWRQRIADLDPVGFLLIAPSVVCLLFALQFGGQDHQWSQGRVLALFVVFGVLLILFVVHQALRGEKATVPPRVIGNRIVVCSCIVALCIGAAMVVFAFYMPIWSQVVKGKTPQSSGLSLIGLLLSNVVFVIAGGVMVSTVGYYLPFAVAGGALLTVGAALISTLAPDTSTGRWIGFEIVTGAGLGLALQQPAIAVQAVLSEADIAVATSILNFVIYLGASVFVTVSQTLLQGYLVRELPKVAPGLDAYQLASNGAGSLKDLVPADKLQEALRIYNDGMRLIWYVGLGLAAGMFVFAFGMGWKNIKEKQAKAKEEEQGKA